jgi:hypothetical protein
LSCSIALISLSPGRQAAPDRAAAAAAILNPGNPAQG